MFASLDTAGGDDHCANTNAMTLLTECTNQYSILNKPHIPKKNEDYLVSRHFLKEKDVMLCEVLEQKQLHWSENKCSKC